LHASTAAKQLRRLARQDTSALEALAERRLAFEVARCEIALPPAFGEPLLVIEQVGFVDRYAAFAPLRLAAGLDHPACLAFFAGPMRRGDLDALLWRLGLLASDERNAKNSDPAE
jgi:hypothetical protein